MKDLEHRVRWATRRNVSQEPLDFYARHYQGVSRGNLSQLDNALYRILYRRHLLHKVPTLNPKLGKKHRKHRHYKDALEIYEFHYFGLTRGSLQRKNPGLYKRLRKDGLLKFVPTKPRTIRDYGNDPREYYKEHYEGFSRGKLRYIDPVFYSLLLRRGLLSGVPVLIIHYEDPLSYYKEHHNGLIREELRKKNPSLYYKLWRESLLKHIPTISTKK